ncbi:conserved hypothetical protein [uncultured Candidatus Thioglobus sp.]|nr:conserved hypothetical protein [uncultured Candidatus Thioglobus sp.]
MYLYLPSVELSIQRVAERVKHGGHNIKTADIERRYSRSIGNLMNEYIDIVDNLTCLDNQNDSDIIFSKSNNEIIVYNQISYDDILRYKNAG